MTLTVNTTNITSGPYPGNGIADTFSYTFKVEDKTQLSVYETDDSDVETLLTVDTDYTVLGIGDDPGGTIVRVAGALPLNFEWYIRSDYKETQLTAFSSQGAFFPDLHENAMDKLTFLIQQLLDEKSRSPSVSISYSGDLPLTLDDPVAGLLLRWKDDLSGLENTSGSSLPATSGIVFIETYGGVGDDGTDNLVAFTVAAADLMAGVITSLQLTAEKIYHVTIDVGNTLYINFIEGNGATIVVNGGGELTYIGGPTNLILNNVDFVKVGGKLTPADLLSAGKPVYRDTDNLTTMETVKLNKTSFTALTTYSNKDSWEDPTDVDQSRAARVIRFTGDDIDVSHIKVRGFARGITITPKVAASGLGTAKHKVIDVEGQNCELLVQLTVFDQDRNGNASDFTETFATGECRNIRINNSTAQAAWWVQQTHASPRTIAGLDSLLVEAHHNNQLVIDNVGGRSVHERPLYNQSGNAIIQNSHDRISGGGGHQIKIDLAAYPETYRQHNTIQDCSHRGTNDSASDWAFYSQADCLLKGLYSTRTNGNTGRFCLSINRKNKDCRFIEGTTEFAGVGIFVNVPQFDTTAFATPGEASQENWIFQDYKLHNVYSTDAVLGSVFGTLTDPNGFPIITFKNTLFKNIEHSFTHEDILNDGGLTSRYSFDLPKMEIVKIRDCNTIFRFTPWRNRECTDIEVIGCNFTQHSNVAAVTAFDKLKPLQTVGLPYIAPLFTPPSTSTITTDSADGSSQDVIDSTADFVSDGVAAGWIAVNQTTGARGEVLSVTDLNTLRLTSGGLFAGGDADGNNNDFVIGDVYYVYAPLNASGASGSGDYRTSVTLTDVSSETEFQSTVETGTVTTPDVAGEVLIDSAATFLSITVKGDTVLNTTDGSDGIVLSVDSDVQLTLTGALENGSDNQWDASDGYDVIHNNVQIGDVVRNITDDSWGRISSITDADNLVMALGLQGGTDNDFEVGDVYRIFPQVWTADKFDFEINSPLNLSQIPSIDPTKWKAHFRKMINTGLVTPFDHLVTLVFETFIEDNKAYNETFTFVELDCTIKVKLGNEQLKFYWHSNSQELDLISSVNPVVLATDIGNISTNIAFYHEPVGNTFVLRTTSTSLAGGEVTITFDTEEGIDNGVDDTGVHTGTSYTLERNDNKRPQTFDNAAAITLTVPAGLGDFNCDIIQKGLGVVTVTPSGTTVNSRSGRLRTNQQHAVTHLQSTAEDVFYYSGDTQN